MRNIVVELKRITEMYNEYGIKHVFKRAYFKIIKPSIKNFKFINQLFANKVGIEIGGPSSIFNEKGYIPIYKVVKNLDGCNFSNSTIWEGNIKVKNEYNYYKDKYGIQYILEATDLSSIEDSKYEFLISSNCLEHVANPLKAIEEWIRVIKKDGFLLLVLPNKEYCFDQFRDFTEFAHLLDDYNNKVKEDDLTHLDEILKYHNLKKDVSAGSMVQFKERCMNNLNNRALHQHVFDLDLMKAIYKHFKLEVLLTQKGEDYIILGRKTV